MNNTAYVLVYGSLRERMGNHRLIERVGKNLIKNDIIIPGYNMKDMGVFPGIIKGNNKIVCELYKTTEECIEGPFDMLEGYNKEDPKRSFYLRKLIDLPDKVKDGEVTVTKAYIYELNQEDADEGNRYSSLNDVPKDEDNIQDWTEYKLSK